MKNKSFGDKDKNNWHIRTKTGVFIHILAAILKKSKMASFFDFVRYVISFPDIKNMNLDV